MTRRMGIGRCCCCRVSRLRHNENHRRVYSVSSLPPGVAVHDYQLEELGPRSFEQLAVALARIVTGPGLQIYGAGPDGGREATFDARIDWARSGDEEAEWNGYTVIQAKHCEHPTNDDPSRNLSWLKSQLRDEIDAWMESENRRSRFPRNLLIVTNVRLSSKDSTGGSIS